MANKMLIDATHPEETRVVVLRGNRVEEFDFESAHRKQLRGNIYLAKVTRVEPSLQAAFVDYGGNRHGFLAFSEIHPDYYQIPIADRQALIDEEERAQRDAEDEADRRSRRHHRGGRRRSAASRDDEVVRSELAEVPAGDAVAADEMADAEPATRAPQRGPEADAAAEIMEDAAGEPHAGEPAEPLADEASPTARCEPVEASAARGGGDQRPRFPKQANPMAPWRPTKPRPQPATKATERAIEIRRERQRRGGRRRG